MEGGESPLDVLSRAATMVQENQALSTTDDPSKHFHPKQTTKWKRDRRNRLPEYSRKSDPKMAETFGSEPTTPEPVSNGANGGTTGSLPLSRGGRDATATDAPLDMSVRQRGLPPSYSQTVNNPGYKSNYRLPVIQKAAPSKEDLPSGMSMCDPIIDEHFRRSLGSDYHALFQNNNVSKEQNVSKSPPKTQGTNAIEMMDSTGLSVDDHFAKALGDTWAKLNKKDQEIQNNSGESGLVST